MLKEKSQEALNDQINAELYSSYLYYAMSAYFEDVKMPGCAHWMRMQAQEELIHVTKFFKFITDRGGRVELKAIDAPPKNWDSPLAVFVETFEHEQMVSERIYKLVDIAHEERDHAMNAFLQWFVNEQIEEEASASEMVDRIELVADDKSGLFIFDKEMSARLAPSTPPAV